MNTRLTFKGFRRGMVAAACLAAGFVAEAATKTQFLMLPQNGFERVNRMQIPDTAEKMTDSDVGCMIYGSVPRNKGQAVGARVDMVNGIIYVLELPMTGWNAGHLEDKQTGYIYTYDSNWNARETTDSPFLTVTARGAGSDFLVTRDEKYIFFSVMEGTNKGKVLRWTRETGAWDDFAVFTSNTDGLRGLAADNAGNLYVAQREEKKIYRFKMDHAPYEAGTYDAVSSSGSYTELNRLSTLVYRPADGRLYAAGWTQVAWFDAETLEQGCEPVTLHALSVVPGYTAGCLSGGEVFFGGGNGSMNGPIFKLTDYENLAAVDVSPWTSGWLAYDFADWQPAIARQNGFGEVGTPSCAGVTLQGGALAGAAGVKGGALALPNDASTAALTDSAAFVPATAAFTVSFWANLAEGAAGTLFSNGAVSVTADADGKLGLAFGATAIATEAVVSDAAWHVIAFTRSTTALNLWMDGALVGSATIDAAVAVGQLENWTFGPVVGNAFFDEFRIYGSALALYAQRSMAAEFGPAATPAMPEQPTAYDQLDPAIGQEVEHAFANEGAIGAPQLFKYKSNWYLSYAVGGTTKIKVSSDGTTWSDFSTLPATGVSLFTLRSGELAAIGQVSETSATAWAYDFTEGKWNERLTYSGTTRFTMLPNTLVNVCNKWGVGVAVKGEAYSGKRMIGYLYFNNRDADTSKLINASLYQTTVEESSNDRTFLPTYSTVKDPRPGIACVDRGQKLGGRTVFESIYPIVDADRPDGKAAAGLERYLIQGFHTYWDDQMEYDYSREHRFVALPGAGKSFSLFKDATTGLYWALTTPVLQASELAGGRAASTIRHRLGLYVSGDLGGWTPCGLVATTGTADTFGYNAPFAVIDGNDLLVAFGVSQDDGAIPPAGTDRSNYLAVRRIADFRTNYVATRPEPKKSTVLYATGGRKRGTVYRHYLDEDGEWHSDALLMTPDSNVTPYDGERAPSFTDSIAVGRRGAVYVTKRGWYWEDADARALRIYRFNRRGNFVQMYKNADISVAWDPARLALSPDESTLYVGVPSKILKLNVATGAFSTFVDNADGKLGSSAASKSLAVDAAGNVYVADNSQYGKVTRFLPNGEQDASFVLWGAAGSPLDWGAWAIAVDDANGKLYVGCRDGQVWKVDLATQAKTKLCNALAGFRSLDGNSHLDAACNSLAVLDGRLFLSSVYGWVREIDTETGVQTPAVNNSLSVGGIGIYKYEKQGSAIIVR